MADEDARQRIHLTEQAEEEVAASGAQLLVAVSGSRVFTGSAAMKEATEVRRLIDALRACGVGDGDVALENVAIEVSKGTIVKSSSATYRLRVRCADVSLLPALLDAIADQKSCRLTGIVWRYETEQATRLACLRRCIQQARAKATAIAEALEVELDGVESIHERSAPPHLAARALSAPGAAPEYMSRARVADELGGMDLAPRRTVSASVDVIYWMKPRLPGGDSTDDKAPPSP